MNVVPFAQQGPRDCLWLALKSREGHWIKVADLMFLAGFNPTKRDPLTPYTSFYFHLEQIKSAGRRNGYALHHEGDNVMLREAHS